MIKLLNHNKEAYEKLVKTFDISNKTAIIHPTGTGKMFIAIKWLYENRDKKCIYIAPSVSIMYQLKQALEECDLSLKDFPNLKLALYSNMLNWDEDDFLGYDNIVLDEFHRAGAPKWGEAVEKLMDKNKEAKVLGLSATPVRYVDKTDMTKVLFDGNIASYMSLAEAISLGILSFPKYIVSLYSYAEEINKYKNIANSIKENEKKTKMLDLIEKASKCLDSLVGIEDILKDNVTRKDGKYLIFCKDIDHLNNMKSIVESWFKSINDVNVYEVHSELEGEMNNDSIDKFMNDNSNSLKILLSVNMLNEGVHVKNIDGVIFLRPTESHIIYLQQLGRALVTDNDSVPLILDVVNNYSSYSSFYDFRDEILRHLGYERYDDTLPIELKERFKIDGVNEDLMNILSQIDKIYISTYTYGDYLEAIKDYLEENKLPYKSIKNNTVYYTNKGVYKIGSWLKYIKAKINKGNLSEELEKVKQELLSLGEEFTPKKRFYDDNVWLEKLDLYIRKYNLNYENVPTSAVYEDETGVYNIGTWLGRIRRKHIEFLDGKRTVDIDEFLIEELKRRGETFTYRNNVYPSSVWISKIKEYLNTTKRTYSSINVNTKYTDSEGITYNIGSWIATRRKIELDYQNKLSKIPLDSYTKNELILLGESFKQITKRMPKELWIEKIKKYLENNTYDSINKDTVYVDDDGIYKIGSWIKDKVLIENRFRDGKSKVPLDKYIKEELTKLGETFSVKFKVNKAPQIKYIEMIKKYLESTGNSYQDINASTIYVDSDGTEYKIGRWIISLRAREIAFIKGKSKKGIDSNIKQELLSLGETFQNQSDLNIQKTMEMAFLVAEYIKLYNVSVTDIKVTLKYKDVFLGKWLYRSLKELEQNNIVSYKKEALYALGIQDEFIPTVFHTIEEYLTINSISYYEIVDNTLYKDIDLSFWIKVLDLKERLQLLTLEELSLLNKIRNINKYNDLFVIEESKLT